MKKDKDSILASLQSNLAPVKKEMVIESGKDPAPSHAEIVIDAEEDYAYARAHIKKLIDTSDEAIGTMHALASDAEHPRAFEVLAGMIKTAAEINGQLLTLQKERKKIIQDETQQKPNNSGGGGTTNNAIFVGTTSELQKLLQSAPTETVEI
jgi:hypothetical protein